MDDKETKVRNVGFTILFAMLALITAADVILLIAYKTYVGLGMYFLIAVGVCMIGGFLCGLLSDKKKLQNLMIALIMIGVLGILVIVGIMVVRLIMVNPWTIISWVVCIIALAALDAIWSN